MKPKPLSSLNHLTVPVAMRNPPRLMCTANAEDAAGRQRLRALNTAGVERGALDMNTPKRTALICRSGTALSQVLVPRRLAPVAGVGQPPATAAGDRTATALGLGPLDSPRSLRTRVFLLSTHCGVLPEGRNGLSARGAMAPGDT